MIERRKEKTQFCLSNLCTYLLGESGFCRTGYVVPHIIAIQSGGLLRWMCAKIHYLIHWRETSKIQNSMGLIGYCLWHDVSFVSDFLYELGWMLLSTSDGWRSIHRIRNAQFFPIVKQPDIISPFKTVTGPCIILSWRKKKTYFCSFLMVYFLHNSR